MTVEKKWVPWLKVLVLTLWPVFYQYFYCNENSSLGKVVCLTKQIAFLDSALLQYLRPCLCCLFPMVGWLFPSHARFWTGVYWSGLFELVILSWVLTISSCCLHLHWSSGRLGLHVCSQWSCLLTADYFCRRTVCTFIRLRSWTEESKYHRCLSGNSLFT